MMSTLSYSIFLFACVTVGTALPPTMTCSEVTPPGCGGNPPNWDKIEEKTIKTPTPGNGEVLISVNASSVNPVDWKLAVDEPILFSRVMGFDAAGIIVALGPGTSGRLSVGDEVWVDIGSKQGAYAEYVVATEQQTGLKPKSMDFIHAGASPLVALTSYQSLIKCGAPWTSAQNATVLITSGDGGTGIAGIGLAKALGATRVVTAAAPNHLTNITALGADVVVDFTKEDVFSVVADDSLLCVYDNYGAAGTADKAMAKLKSGGAFVFLPGKGGALSKHPKPGVNQYSLWTDSSDHKDLDAIAAFVDQGKMVTLVSSVYSLADVPKAFASEYAGKTLGKIAIAVSP